MFVKVQCPCCKETFVEMVEVECLEEQTFENENEGKRYILDNVIVKTSEYLNKQESK